MFKIDKAQFGRFVSARRKEKGFTQKELAEKLLISDKAVSKWERGLSLPDITLLIPLAELLELTVTELLEGRIMEPAARMDAGQVEDLVKKALAYPEKLPEKSKEKKKKHWLIFAACILAVFWEWTVYVLVTGSFLALFQNGVGIIQLLSLLFGAHFWIRAKEQLPAYYDENEIHVYQDGLFEMNLPGVCLNNRNWPSILRVGRIWSVLGTTAVPACYLVISLFLPDMWMLGIGPCITLAFSLIGLFLPMYLVCKKQA